MTEIKQTNIPKKRKRTTKKKIEKIDRVDKVDKVDLHKAPQPETQRIIVMGIRPAWFGNRKVLPGEEAEIETKYLKISPSSFRILPEKLNKRNKSNKGEDNDGIMEGETSNN